MTNGFFFRQKKHDADKHEERERNIAEDFSFTCYGKRIVDDNQYQQNADDIRKIFSEIKNEPSKKNATNSFTFFVSPVHHALRW